MRKIMKMVHYFMKEKENIKKAEKITLLIFYQQLRFVNGEMQVQGVYAQSQEGAYSVQTKPLEKILVFTVLF